MHVNCEQSKIDRVVIIRGMPSVSELEPLVLHLNTREHRFRTVNEQDGVVLAIVQRYINHDKTVALRIANATARGRQHIFCGCLFVDA